MAFLLLMLMNLSVFAQHSEQPAAESSTDLRNQTVVFSIEEVGKDKTIWLLRTSGLDYFLKMKNDGEETVRKIDSRSAQKLDRDFAASFLKCEYEIPKSEGECAPVIKMTMKGEQQDICQKDDRKSQEMAPLLKELHKRF